MPAAPRPGENSSYKCEEWTWPASQDDTRSKTHETPFFDLKLVSYSYCKGSWVEKLIYIDLFAPNLKKWLILKLDSLSILVSPDQFWSVFNTQT